MLPFRSSVSMKVSVTVVLVAGSVMATWATSPAFGQGVSPGRLAPTTTAVPGGPELGSACQVAAAWAPAPLWRETVAAAVRTAKATTKLRAIALHPARLSAVPGTTFVDSQGA